MARFLEVVVLLCVALASTTRAADIRAKLEHGEADLACVVDCIDAFLNTNNNLPARLAELLQCIPECLGTSTSAPSTSSFVTTESAATTTSAPTCQENLFDCFDQCVTLGCKAKCYPDHGIEEETRLACKQQQCRPAQLAATGQTAEECMTECACDGGPSTTPAPTCPPLNCVCDPAKTYQVTFLNKETGCTACRCKNYKPSDITDSTTAPTSTTVTYTKSRKSTTTA